MLRRSSGGCPDESAGARRQSHRGQESAFGRLGFQLPTTAGTVVHFEIHSYRAVHQGVDSSCQPMLVLCVTHCFWSTALWYIKAYILVTAWYTFVRNVYRSAADVCNVWCEVVFNWWWDMLHWGVPSKEIQFCFVQQLDLICVVIRYDSNVNPFGKVEM